MTALTIAGFIIGGILGYLLAAILTMGKVTDLERELWALRCRLYRLDPEERT